jgi:FK506-binding protein 4/5
MLRFVTPKLLDEVVVRWALYPSPANSSSAAAPLASAASASFSLPAGHLCPALPMLVKTMKLGEIARATIQPAYAFGANSDIPAGSSAEFRAPPGVPSDVPLVLEVELLAIHAVDQVISSAPGAVLMKTLTEGDGWEVPNDRASVTVNFTGRLLLSSSSSSSSSAAVDSGEGAVLEKREGFTFNTDEEAVVEGLDRAVCKMKRGSRAVVTIHDGKVRKKKN